MRKKKPQRIPLRRFKYDAHQDRVKCPGGAYLNRKGRDQNDRGYWYRARPCDCSSCPLKTRCISEQARSRSLLIVDGYTALLRARRRKAKGWDAPTREMYTRHRWRVEGTHGRAKAHHGLRRAARRGLFHVAIQAYLAAAVMNLKRLAMALFNLLFTYMRIVRTYIARFVAKETPETNIFKEPKNSYLSFRKAA